MQDLRDSSRRRRTTGRNRGRRTLKLGAACITAVAVSAAPATPAEGATLADYALLVANLSFLASLSEIGDFSASLDGNTATFTGTDEQDGLLLGATSAGIAHTRTDPGFQDGLDFDSTAVGPQPLDPTLDARVVVNFGGGDDIVFVLSGPGSTLAVTVEGGAGGDGIGGTVNGDEITGGPGQDAIRSMDGDDIIDVADGEADEVDCGPGNDTILADSLDLLVDCENATVDTAAPQITVATPVQGATYLLGHAVIADYSCSDEPGGSGLSTCNGTVPDGAAIDTSTVGPKTFAVTATDVAGNPASSSVTYAVAAKTDLAVTLTGPATAPKGSVVTYSLSVTNAGPLAATDVKSVIGVSGLSNVTTNPATGSGSVTISGRQLSGALWRTASLAPGATATFTLSGKVNVSAGKYVAAVGGALAATPPDPRLINNIGLATTRST